MGLARLLPRPNLRPSLEAARDPVEILALANQKGGVAKTTTTLNLGVAFAERGYRVLLIDLDPQGNLTMSQGLNPDTIERSMFDVLVNRMPIEQVIERREVDIAVSSIDLAGADMALSSQIGRERALQKALAPIMDRYDYILMDTPPGSAAGRRRCSPRSGRARAAARRGTWQRRTASSAGCVCPSCAGRSRRSAGAGCGGSAGIPATGSGLPCSRSFSPPRAQPPQSSSARTARPAAHRSSRRR